MAKQTEEHVVRAVPEPEFTDTWHPVSHARLLDAMETACNESGLAVQGKVYDLSQDGLDLFGRWTLDVGTTNGRNYELGFRQSLKKRFAIGFCAGLQIVVCSNLMFQGEFLEFRKHTSGLDDYELGRLTISTIQNILPKIEDMKTWHAELRNYPLQTAHHKILTYNAMKSGALPPSKFNQFHDAYELEAQQDNEGNTLYAWHGGMTRVMREDSIHNIMSKNDALERVVNGYRNFVDGRLDNQLAMR